MIEFIKRNSLFLLGIFLTAGFVLTAFLFLTDINSCPPSKYSSCLTPSELGDLSAGIFAPLAFIWLVIAVLMQSKELAMQRVELTGMRSAMQAQAEQAGKNAEFIEQQTKIMLSARKEISEDKHYERAISDLEGVMRYIHRTTFEVGFDLYLLGEKVGRIIPPKNVVKPFAALPFAEKTEVLVFRLRQIHQEIEHCGASHIRGSILLKEDADMLDRHVNRIRNLSKRHQSKIISTSLISVSISLKELGEYPHID